MNPEPGDTERTSNVPRPTSPQAWHQSTAFLVGAILVLGPLALPLIWANKKISLLMKAVLSIGLVALTLFLLKATGGMLESLRQQLNQIREIQTS